MNHTSCVHCAWARGNRIGKIINDYSLLMFNVWLQLLAVDLIFWALYAKAKILKHFHTYC